MKLLIPSGYKEQETLLVAGRCSSPVIYFVNSYCLFHRGTSPRRLESKLGASVQFDGPYVGGVTKIGFIVAVVALTVGVQFFKSICNSNK